MDGPPNKVRQLSPRMSVVCKQLRFEVASPTMQVAPVGCGSGYGIEIIDRGERSPLFHVFWHYARDRCTVQIGIAPSYDVALALAQRHYQGGTDQ